MFHLASGHICDLYLDIHSKHCIKANDHFYLTATLTKFYFSALVPLCYNSTHLLEFGRKIFLSYLQMLMFYLLYGCIWMHSP